MTSRIDARGATLVYLVFVRLLDWLALLAGSNASKEAEIWCCGIQLEQALSWTLTPNGPEAHGGSGRPPCQGLLPGGAGDAGPSCGACGQALGGDRLAAGLAYAVVADADLPERPVQVGEMSA